MSNAVASSSSHRLSEDAIAATHNVHCALSPRIGVLSSPDVFALLEANHLNTFSDLLRPFEDSIEHLTVRTSQLETRRCDTFPLSFDDLNVFAPQSASASTSTLFTPADLVSSEPLESSEKASNARQVAPRYSRPELLLDEISARVSAKSKAVWEIRNEPSSKRYSRRVSSLGGNAESLKVFLTAEDESNLERFKNTPIETLTPWFADTKSMVLNTRNVSEHETFGHPLAIMLVVSASSPDPMNAFAALFEASQANTNRAFTLRPFVDPHILQYYVLLHDVSTSGPDMSESIALLENVKKTYGLHCCLLPINSGAGATNGDGASFRISKLYSNALRHERRSTRASKSNDAPPAVPTKDGQSEKTAPELSQMSTSEDESLRWNAAKEEAAEYGAALTEEDVKKIRSFVRDFAAQSLIPFLERCVSLWNEQLAASRRGLTGRLFGAASRKFFSGGSVRGSHNQTAASFTTLGYYPHSSIEAQSRRLADFAFMTRDYKLAAAMYDLGRKDYANDKAVKYIAGANEMFGLSHLMIMLCTHSPPIDVDSYLASAGQHYLVSPRQKGSALQLNSLRATLLYYEVYRGLHFYRSAPSALVRTATEGSGEAENDLEVAGAMLLEQAAIADLRQSDGPALRKCALHLVMAAHRYRSCGQKHLSLRCFQGAASFYLLMRKNRYNLKAEANEEDGRERMEDYIAAHESGKVAQWDLIEDHLEQELGQQASSEGQASQAVLHLFALLRRQRQSVFSTLEESSQKHEACLQEFLNCCKYLETDFMSLLRTQDQEASLSLVDTSKAMIQINATTRSSDDQWLDLEKEAQIDAESQLLKALKQSNLATVNEPFHLVLILVNPLNTPLKVTSLTVDLQDDNGEMLNNELASVDVLEEENFAPLQARSVSISISVKQPCKVRCSSVSYLLAGQVAFQESLLLKGRRLNDTKEQRTSLQPIYAMNESLTVTVENAKPELEAKMANHITRLGLGEELEAEVLIENKGTVPLQRLRVVVNRSDMILTQGTNLPDTVEGEMQLGNDLKSSKKLTISIPDEVLAGGASMKWPVLLRGSALGELDLRLLFVYESDEGEVLTSQLQYAIQVDAVIDLAVQVEPLHAEEDLQYQIRVDGINLSDPEEEENITIQTLSFVSPSWKIVTNSDEGKAALESFKNLPHMQRQSTSMVLQSQSSSVAIKDVDFTVRQLQSLLTGRSIDKDHSPGTTSVNVSHVGDTAQISHFLLQARKEYRLTSLLDQFPSIQSAKDLQRIFILYEPNQVDVIAHWQMSKSKRKGQAFVFGLNVGPLHDYFESLFVKNQDKYTRSLYAEAEKEKAALWMDVTRNRLHIEEDPILFDFVVPLTPVEQQQQQQSHSTSNGDSVGAIFATKNGGSNRIVFPVEFLVRNLSTQRTRDVVLQLDNTLSPASTALLRAKSAVSASYINRLTYRVTLAPQSSSRIHAKASINKCGNVILAPVLVKSTVTNAESSQERLFQRWEHCTNPIKVLQTGS